MLYFGMGSFKLIRACQRYTLVLELLTLFKNRVFMDIRPSFPLVTKTKGDLEMQNKKVLFITQAAVIAALYVVLTMVAAGFNLASGAIQVRFSEALCFLRLNYLFLIYIL